MIRGPRSASWTKRKPCTDPASSSTCDPPRGQGPRLDRQRRLSHELRDGRRERDWSIHETRRLPGRVRPPDLRAAARRADTAQMPGRRSSIKRASCWADCWSRRVASGRWGSVVEIHMLAALVLDAQGRRPTPWMSLGQAFAAGSRTGRVRAALPRRRRRDARAASWRPAARRRPGPSGPPACRTRAARIAARAGGPLERTRGAGPAAPRQRTQRARRSPVSCSSRTTRSAPTPGTSSPSCR